MADWRRRVAAAVLVRDAFVAASGRTFAEIGREAGRYPGSS